MGAPSHEYSPELRSLVTAELPLIFQSPGFRQSEQSRRLLRYMVEKSLEGRADLLKERAIGVAVFGREVGYDTNESPIVRVRANELRKRLAKYFQDRGEGAGVVLDIPPGAYRVEFWMPPGAAPAPESAPLPEVAPLARRVPAERTGRWALIAAGLLVIAGVGIWGLRRPADVLEDFWRPALNSPSPVILATGHPVVYRFTRGFEEKIRGAPPDHFRTLTDPLAIPAGQAITGDDVVPVPDQYVGLGSAQALARVQGWLAWRHREAEIRFGNDLSFTDLRKAPAVLIGAFQNRWTLEFNRDLRFVFETLDRAPSIRDTQTGKVWSLPRMGEAGRTDHDYVLVSRLVRARSGQFLVMAAGITQYGGYAAGELLTNPSLIAESLRAAKPGWAKRNLQLLYQVQVIGHTTGPPVLLAIYDW